MISLNEARIMLNEIDSKMVILFEQDQKHPLSTTKEKIATLRKERLMIIKDVAIYKHKHKLPIYDPQREQELIKRNCDLLEDKSLIPNYLIFINELLLESKNYQKAFITSQYPDASLPD
ncbi:MAG: chorismate mutase [Erysipelotrichaceae bacterium]|nr:chorismate mutase [Erysipelotrichaceae bacterium]